MSSNNNFFPMFFISNNNFNDLSTTNPAVFEKENINQEDYKEIPKSICKIDLAVASTYGFLIEFPINNNFPPIKGLLTNSKILNETQINQLSQITLIFEYTGKKINLPINKTNFIFNDLLLDATFIEIKEEELSTSINDIPFLKIDLSNLKKNDSILIFNSIQMNSSFSLTSGRIFEPYGFNLFLNDISSDFGYEGMPLISVKSRKVCGIYKKNMVKNNLYNVATSIEIVYLAIKRLVENSNNYNLIKIGDAKFLEQTEINKLKSHGLDMISMFLWVSPASPFVTPIWFYRTCYGWFWTPTEPKEEMDEVNWMIILHGRSKKVVGGFWNGIEPAPKNINIIDWLDVTGLELLNY